MKSKLTMLTLVGTLALGAVAPNAMAKNQKGAAAVSPRSVAGKTSLVAKAPRMKQASRTAWVPSHVLFNGLQDK
jgi:hypothetical protein